MSAPAKVSGLSLNRRRFVQAVSLGSAGFVVGCGDRAADSAAAPADDVTAALNTFVRVASDNTVTVVIKHLDKGQGVTTGLAAIVAEELGADWSQIRTEFAPADASLYNNLFFGPGTGHWRLDVSGQQLDTAAHRSSRCARDAARRRR